MYVNMCTLDIGSAYSKWKFTNIYILKNLKLSLFESLFQLEKLVDLVFIYFFREHMYFLIIYEMKTTYVKFSP